MKRNCIFAIILLFLLLACNSKKENELQFVTSDLEKTAYVPKIAADEKQYGKTITQEEIGSKKEAQRPKTIVLDCETMLLGRNYWSHIEMEPDGTLNGKALFVTNVLSNDVEESFTGSWHTGRTQRGNAYITYYEFDINDSEWYITEKFDYLWRGDNAYEDMCHNNIDNAGKIVKKTEK